MSGTPKRKHIRRHAPPELFTKLKTAAREMRKSPTPAEDALWQRLRDRQLGGLHFRRQHSFERFIVDFYCARAHLVVEVDGPIHDEQVEYDHMRQSYLESLGLSVLRFSNDEVLGQIESVLKRIEKAIVEGGEM